jgi:hypothetical protein
MWVNSGNYPQKYGGHPADTPASGQMLCPSFPEPAVHNSAQHCRSSTYDVPQAPELQDDWFCSESELVHDNVIGNSIDAFCSQPIKIIFMHNYSNTLDLPSS